MDPSLLKDRELFKKRALAVPVIEKKHDKRKSENAADETKTKRTKAAPVKKDFDYKTSSAGSSFRFGILTKIVKHMKQRHQEGESHALSVDDILDETNQSDISAANKNWLTTEALRNNPKLTLVNPNSEGGGEDRYLYKPKLDIRSKKGLLRLLEKNYRDGQGAVPYDDVEEALPNAKKAVTSLGSQIVTVTRSTDKKQALLYVDKMDIDIDEEITKCWRGSSVEGTDETKIEEYLSKHGLLKSSMSGILVKAAIPKAKRKGSKKSGLKKSHNEHMAGILQDYTDKN